MTDECAMTDRNTALMHIVIAILHSLLNYELLEMDTTVTRHNNKLFIMNSSPSFQTLMPHRPIEFKRLNNDN